MTKTAERRQENFERVSNDLKLQGYRERKCTISILRANLVPFILMLPLTILADNLWQTFVLSGRQNSPELVSPLQLVLFLLMLIVLHEAFHGLTWAIFTENHLRSIGFGVIWKLLMPYCTCLVPLKKWQYMLGIAMPTVILGFGLMIPALLYRSSLLFFSSILMIYGGGADLYVFLELLFQKKTVNDVVYIDHPSECGYVVFEKQT